MPAAVLTEPAEEQDDPFGLVDDVAEGRRGRFLRRRVLTPRRRPALYLAAALIGALGVSLTTGEPQAAQAETATVSHSVSVAEELGIELEAQPIEEITPEAATERLGELAASRTERDAGPGPRRARPGAGGPPGRRRPPPPRRRRRRDRRPSCP